MVGAEEMEPEGDKTSSSAHDLVHACKVFLNVYAIIQSGRAWSFVQLQHAVAWADVVEKACLSITSSPLCAARAAVQGVLQGLTPPLQHITFEDLCSARAMLLLEACPKILLAHADVDSLLRLLAGAKGNYPTAQRDCPPARGSPRALLDRARPAETLKRKWPGDEGNDKGDDTSERKRRVMVEACPLLSPVVHIQEGARSLSHAATQAINPTIQAAAAEFRHHLATLSALSNPRHMRAAFSSLPHPPNQQPTLTALSHPPYQQPTLSAISHSLCERATLSHTVINYGRPLHPSASLSTSDSPTAEPSLHGAPHRCDSTQNPKKSNGNRTSTTAGIELPTAGRSAPGGERACLTRGESGGECASLLNSCFNTHGIATFPDLASAVGVRWGKSEGGTCNPGECCRQRGWREIREVPRSAREGGGCRDAAGSEGEWREWREAAAVDALEWAVSEEVIARMSAAAAVMQGRQWTRRGLLKACRKAGLAPADLFELCCFAAVAPHWSSAISRWLSHVILPPSLSVPPKTLSRPPGPQGPAGVSAGGPHAEDRRTPAPLSANVHVESARTSCAPSAEVPAKDGRYPAAWQCVLPSEKGLRNLPGFPLGHISGVSCPPLGPNIPDPSVSGHPQGRDVPDAGVSGPPQDPVICDASLSGPLPPATPPRGDAQGGFHQRSDVAESAFWKHTWGVCALSTESAERAAVLVAEILQGDPDLVWAPHPALLAQCALASFPCAHAVLRAMAVAGGGADGSAEMARWVHLVAAGGPLADLTCEALQRISTGCQPLA